MVSVFTEFTVCSSLRQCFELLCVVFLWFLVQWSCQFIARASNTSLWHWHQMSGIDIKEDMIIDKVIHKYSNARSSVLKVRNYFFFHFFPHQKYYCFSCDNILTLAHIIGLYEGHVTDLIFSSHKAFFNLQFNIYFAEICSRHR